MSPVDGIKAPKKIKKKNSGNKSPDNVKIEDENNSSININAHHKKNKLVWILSISTAVIIFLAWLLLFDISNLADKNNSSGYWKQVTQKIDNLWDSFKSNILKIDDTIEEIPITQDEKIKELESQVFPQFEDPTRQ